MKQLFLFILFTFIISCAKSQEQKTTQQIIGGPCEGCDNIYDYGKKTLNSVDTLPLFSSAKEKMKLSGIVYEIDGKTPAKDIIIYAYQTDEKGVYPKNSTVTGGNSGHGYIRGWVKTNARGEYAFYTFRPASYPKTTVPQHIHFIIKEPDKNEYYIDDIYFEDDPNLTDRIKNRSNFRGGKGIVQLIKKNDIYKATRNIILGKNIPNYN